MRGVAEAVTGFCGGNFLSIVSLFSYTLFDISEQEGYKTGLIYMVLDIKGGECALL